MRILFYMFCGWTEGNRKRERKTLDVRRATVKVPTWTLAILSPAHIIIGMIWGSRLVPSYAAEVISNRMNDHCAFLVGDEEAAFFRYLFPRNKQNFSAKFSATSLQKSCAKNTKIAVKENVREKLRKSLKKMRKKFDQGN